MTASSRPGTSTSCRLSAELVDLSASQTALGKEVRAKGCIGSPAASCMPGRPGYIASLWRMLRTRHRRVHDSFYRGVLRQVRLPPGAACGPPKDGFRGREPLWVVPTTGPPSLSRPTGTDPDASGRSIGSRRPGGPGARDSSRETLWPRKSSSNAIGVGSPSSWRAPAPKPRRSATSPRRPSSSRSRRSAGAKSGNPSGSPVSSAPWEGTWRWSSSAGPRCVGQRPFPKKGRCPAPSRTRSRPSSASSGPRSCAACFPELASERDRQILFRFYIAEDEKEAICRDLRSASLHFNRVLFRARERYRELYLEALKRTHKGPR